MFDLSEANPRQMTCGSGYREVPETERWEKIGIPLGMHGY